MVEMDGDDLGFQDELILDLVQQRLHMELMKDDEDEDDEGVWDSMAVMATEEWNKGNPDEIGITRDKLLPKGISELTEQQRGDIFLRAAQTGLLELVKELYTAYGKELLLFKDEDQYTALHRASYNGHKHIVEYLLNEGADIHSRTEDGWQPIHCACRWNKVEVASLLLQNGANINSLTNGHQTPLHLAACNNRSKATLELLLMHPDIDVTLRNSRGETARELVVSLGQLGYLFEMKEECIDYSISRTKS